MQNNLHTDVAIATGGITAPVWLAPMNEWLAAITAIFAIILLILRIYKTVKTDKDID